MGDLLVTSLYVFSPFGDSKAKTISGTHSSITSWLHDLIGQSSIRNKFCSLEAPFSMVSCTPVLG